MAERKKYVVASGGSRAIVYAKTDDEAFEGFICSKCPEDLGQLTSFFVDGQTHYQDTVVLLKAVGRYGGKRK